MTTNDDYQPISCGAYDEVEVLAMRRTAVVLDVVDDQGDDQRIEGLVVDTSIHDGAEFMVLEVHGERRELRLDRLRRIDVR